MAMFRHPAALKAYDAKLVLLEIQHTQFRTLAPEVHHGLILTTHEGVVRRGGDAVREAEAVAAVRHAREVHEHLAGSKEAAGVVAEDEGN